MSSKILCYIKSITRMGAYSLIAFTTYSVTVFLVFLLLIGAEIFGLIEDIKRCGVPQRVQESTVNAPFAGSTPAPTATPHEVD